MDARQDTQGKRTTGSSKTEQHPSEKQIVAPPKDAEANDPAKYPYPALLPYEKVAERYANDVNQMRMPFPFHIWKIVNEELGEDPVQLLQGLHDSGVVWCDVQGISPFPDTWNEVSRIEEATNKDIYFLFARGLHQVPMENGRSVYECKTFGFFRKDEGMKDWRLVVTKGNVCGTMSSLEYTEKLEFDRALFPTTAEHREIWQYIKDWDERERESWRMRHSQCVRGD